VPARQPRHVLYAEPASDYTAPLPGVGRGIRRRLLDIFDKVLAGIEREPEDGDDRQAEKPTGWTARLRSRARRWVSEKVAEQRVLWRLQGQRRVRAFYPDQLDPETALAIVRRILAADSRRHLGLAVLDTLYLLVALLLTPIPGPNLPGYYFTFRVVGHVLSVRGARQGLARVEWDLEASAPLGELTGASSLPGAERARLVRAVADRLGLPRFPKFCDRLLGDVA